MIRVRGLPPYKDEKFSIRNIKHKHYERFSKLREEGIKAMDGRAWSHGPIAMKLELHASNLEKNRMILDYAAGIEDTLDGSSGFTFTYLPIVFEDDCQICDAKMSFVKDDETWYYLEFEIIDSNKLAN